MKIEDNRVSRHKNILTPALFVKSLQKDIWFQFSYLKTSKAVTALILWTLLKLLYPTNISGWLYYCGENYIS